MHEWSTVGVSNGKIGKVMRLAIVCLLKKGGLDDKEDMVS